MFHTGEIREGWLRVERALGLIDEVSLSVRRSTAAVRRSHSILDRGDPLQSARQFERGLRGSAPLSGLDL